MASNLTDIADAINNLNLTYNQTNISNILYDSIDYMNVTSNGWGGIIMFVIMSMSVLIFIYASRQEFMIFSKFNILLSAMSVSLDIGFYLIVFGILEDLPIYGSVFSIFFVLLYVSLIRKDMKEVSS